MDPIYSIFIIEKYLSLEYTEIAVTDGYSRIINIESRSNIHIVLSSRVPSLLLSTLAVIIYFHNIEYIITNPRHNILGKVVIAMLP